jgi:hypothetical protein
VDVVYKILECRKFLCDYRATEALSRRQRDHEGAPLLQACHRHTKKQPSSISNSKHSVFLNTAATFFTNLQNDRKVSRSNCREANLNANCVCKVPKCPDKIPDLAVTGGE